MVVSPYGTRKTPFIIMTIGGLWCDSIHPFFTSMHSIRPKELYQSRKLPHISESTLRVPTYRKVIMLDNWSYSTLYNVRKETLNIKKDPDNEKKPVYITRTFFIISNPLDYIILRQDFYLGTNEVQTHFQIRMHIYQTGL